ncbi:MAG: N-acetylmuramoyl-L-alanine amidase [Oscillospiraceae bacterium]|nr:N-acetylmuramoyl-L-alanine amidase [Oscillospiraceae bacterium]
MGNARNIARRRKVIKILGSRPFAAALVAVAMLFLSLTYRAAVLNRSAMQSLVDGQKPVTAIIDAGHGGIDGGTSAADGTLEKVLNLQIAEKLNDILRLYGYSTVMTRTDDNSIYDPGTKTIRKQKVSDINNRMAIMNKTDNCIFISIHQNYIQGANNSGSIVFYSGNNEESKILADFIQQSIKKSLQPESKRGTIKSGSSIYLLHNAKKPAVLVECGFLSNPNETKLLKSEDYQKKLAFSIANGILDYINYLKEE